MRHEGKDVASNCWQCEAPGWLLIRWVCLNCGVKHWEIDEQIKAEEEQRKRQEAEEEEMKRRQEQQQQAAAPIEAPQGKAQRGDLFGRKKRKQAQVTTENRPSQGKQ